MVLGKIVASLSSIELYPLLSALVLNMPTLRPIPLFIYMQRERERMQMHVCEA